MIRWGVAGTGGVSTLFAEAIAATEGGEVIAVASRDEVRGVRFADQWGIPHSGDYEHLAHMEAPDVVYVATPPALHCEFALAALNAGKHVLCEKPLGASLLDAQTMATAAKDNGVFLMEAMWCRFLPAYTRLRQLLAERYVGDIVSMEASFGIKQPNHARPEWSAELGGGALLTGGMYPIQLAHMILGAPKSVSAFGAMGDVDEASCALLRYKTGAVATVSSAIIANLSNGARINGTDGTIVLPSVTQAEAVNAEQHPLDRPRLAYEIEHVHQCLAEGRTESPVMPLSESVAIAETIDKIRACL